MWDLPRPGIEPMSPLWHMDSLPLNHQGSLIHWFFNFTYSTRSCSPFWRVISILWLTDSALIRDCSSSTVKSKSVEICQCCFNHLFYKDIYFTANHKLERWETEILEIVSPGDQEERLEIIMLLFLNLRNFSSPFGIIFLTRFSKEINPHTYICKTKRIQSLSTSLL